MCNVHNLPFALSFCEPDLDEEEASSETSGIRSPDTNSTKDYCPGLLGFLTASDLECSLCIRSVN